MSLTFQKNGNLIPGITVLTIKELEDFYGYNEKRKNLISGLKIGIDHLRNCGCKRIFIDGSFVSKKELPGDFDVCWDVKDVDLLKIQTLYPVLLDFSQERKNQKIHYQGEFFPAQADAIKNPRTSYYHFFQKDRDDIAKGIIQINLI